MRSIFTVFILLIALFSAGQGILSDNVGISVKAKGGMLIAHRAVMAHLVQGHALAAELALDVETNGDCEWERTFNRPTYGFSYFTSTTGNKEILGYTHSLFSYLETPFLRYKNFSWTGKMGFGIGYVTKKFNQLTNPKNNAIGSHINGFVQFGSHIHFTHLKSKYTFGIDMSHFSNGSSSLPNLGLNLPYFSLGYTHLFTDRKIDNSELEKKLLNTKWKYGVIGIASANQVFPTGGRTYPVIALSSFAQKTLKRMCAIEFALDLISNQSHFKVYEEIKKTQLKVLQIGTYIGYVLPLNNNFQASTGIGYYVKNQIDPDGFIYNRLFFRYIGNKNLILQLGIKAHFAKADYFEFGIGYKLR